MPFRGISIDDEGSIIYDGKKFIVNNPSKVSDDFDPGDKEVVGLPENHPSRPQNRKLPPIPKYVPPLVIYTAFDKHRANEHQRRVEEASDNNKSKKKEKKRQKPMANEPSLLDFPQDMEWAPDIQKPPVRIEQSWVKKLSEGQKLQIDYLLSTEDDSLVSNMLIALKVEGMPEWISFDDYMKRFAEWGWDEESDQRARETWQSIMQDRADASIESLPVFGDRWWNQRIEETLADQADDTIESLQVIDAATGRVLLNRMGVLGAGGQQYVGLQAEDIRLFQGHELIFVHNHPNGREASEADLRTAFVAGAEMLLVLTPRGYEYVYIRGEGRMVLVREGEGNYEAAPSTAEEYVELEGRSWRQAQADRRNPPEYFMFQDVINIDSRLVSEFFLDPATVIFLEDVANEYGVEDSSLYSALVFTIIYRELQAPGSLENADNPVYQHNWDQFKALANLPSYILGQLNLPPIPVIDGDPSLGIGALNRKAIANIEEDSEQLGMNMYLPMLGYDMPATLDHIPFSQGDHTIEMFAGSEITPRKLSVKVIPPTNEEYGAWRIELPRFASQSLQGLQERYEPTLGYIAAEVAIAMQSPKYQELHTEEERIAFTIGYHANRSAKPAKNLYDPTEFQEATYTEIRWVKGFQGLIHHVKNQIQRSDHHG